MKEINIRVNLKVRLRDFIIILEKNALKQEVNSSIINAHTNISKEFLKYI